MYGDYLRCSWHFLYVLRDAANPEKQREKIVKKALPHGWTKTHPVRSMSPATMKTSRPWRKSSTALRNTTRMFS